jgi:hypothetical protein
MRALPVLAICSLAGIVCAVAVGATADEPAPSESEASIRRGVELRREGRNGEALVEFQKGFALDPTPRARAQIGLALQALGDWLGAEGWLQDALNAHDDAWITRYETDLRAALATVRAHLGSLSLHVDAQEGEVLVNGAPATALPSSGPIQVVAGSVDVIVRVPGHADVHRVVQVAAVRRDERRRRGGSRARATGTCRCLVVAIRTARGRPIAPAFARRGILGARLGGGARHRRRRRLDGAPECRRHLERPHALPAAGGWNQAIAVRRLQGHCERRRRHRDRRLLARCGQRGRWRVAAMAPRPLVDGGCRLVRARRAHRHVWSRVLSQPTRRRLRRRLAIGLTECALLHPRARPVVAHAMPKP